MAQHDQTREVLIERLTSDEIATAIADGARTAILPLGSTEQHGPHLTVSVDSDHAEALAIRVAHRLGTALVLPAVRVGFSPHHLAFPGTLSVRASTLEAICLDYCSSLASHGFERVFLFSGHIGNYPAMREFAARLGAKLSPLQVLVFGDGSAILDAWRRAAESVAGRGNQIGGHADLAETSLMLVLHPDRVRRERVAAGYDGPVDDAVLRGMLRDGIAAIAPNGVLGDPTGSSVAIGHAVLEEVTDLLVAFAMAHGA